LKKSLYIIALVILVAIAYRMGQNSILFSDAEPLNYSIANSVWDVVDDKYLRADEIETDDIKYGLAKGLVSAIGDDHSTFFDPEESAAFMTSLNGDLQGIGAELKLVDGLVMVVSPLPDSPAEKAGILPGDIIIKVNDENLGVVSNLLELVMKIRGPKGTEVTLTVIHEDNPVPEDISIIRDEIHLQAATFHEEEYQDEKIAVINLSSFTESIGNEFEELLRQVNFDGYDKLIIDMRYNGGGYLEGAIDIVSYFIDPNLPVVHIKDRNNEEARNSSAKTLRFNGKIVVLVNEVSASASEIVAGALKEYDKAQVIGTKTYGKGSVQEVHPFLDSSMMRITVAEWLTPEKNNIEGVGIEPNQIVELDFEQFKEGTDNQMDAALMYLTNSASSSTE